MSDAYYDGLSDAFSDGYDTGHENGYESGYAHGKESEYDRLQDEVRQIFNNADTPNDALEEIRQLFYIG